MSINLTDELIAKTKKGKISSAKQVFLEGDQENLQQIGDKTHQLEDAVKDITVTGGASTANAVSYNNKTSGMTSVTAQGAIDELATKNKAQDAIIETKAEKAEVTAELEKKFDKESILQESGDAEDKVMSQKATTTAITDETTRAKAAEEAILFDVSANNNGAVFESLSALLNSSDLSILIPTSVRHGGMIIRFIQGSEQSSDNKYVQFRLMSNSFNTTLANWQGVDDEPISGSKNLIESGGVYKELYNEQEKTLSWVENLIAESNAFRTRNGKKCSQPFLLRKRESITIYTSGDSSYVMTPLVKVNADSSIAGGYGNITIITQNSSSPKTYNYTATEDIYVSVCVNMSDGVVTFSNLQSKSKFEKLEENLDTLKEEINKNIENIENINDTIYKQEEKEYSWINGLVCTDGGVASKGSDKVTSTITLYKGETVKVKTKGDGSYLFSVIARVASANFVPSPGLAASNLVRITSNSLTEYSYTATENIYIVISVLDDLTSEVSFENLHKINKIEENSERINELEQRVSSKLHNKSVLFFGDSLTAASTTGITGFAEIIADNCGTKYEAGLYSGQSPQTIDVDHTFYNFAKDGTTNHTVVGRTDSVVDKVKNLVNVNSAAEYILIECCVNDLASEYRNIGTKAATYTEAFDITSSLGAIEEVIRYITTLGTGIKLGFFIPWTITWGDYTEFDKYVEVFKKWCVPYLDLRDKAGFNMRDYSVHSNLYSLSSDSYAAYDDTTTYNLDDKVKYSGSLYKCLANGVVGIPPTDSSKWMIVSSSSSDGTHLNNLGHKVVAGKIQNFIESL